MNPVLIITILRAVLCEPEIKKFLEKAAADSNTPIDDVTLGVLYMLLACK